MPTPEPEKRVKRPRLRLPFEKRKQDAGSWTYDHRIGLCVTLIAYLVLMIAFVSSKIVVGRKPHTQGMYIDRRRGRAGTGARHGLGTAGAPNGRRKTRSTGGASRTRFRTKTR